MDSPPAERRADSLEREIRPAGARCTILLVFSRRFTIALMRAALIVGGTLFALTARNDFCPPWQERVGFGDGPLGPSQDYSGCR